MTNRVEIDDCLMFLPRNLTAITIGVSLPTLREYQSYLNQLSPTGWDYKAGDRGFTRQSLEVLMTFRELVSCIGKRQAILQICSTMREKHHGKTQS